MTKEERNNALKVIRNFDLNSPKVNLLLFSAEEITNAFDMAIEALRREPKTGHWIVAKGASYLGKRNGCCSNCKDFYTNDWNMMNYCPNCGADMRGEQDE